jgi:spore maturation protein A
MLNYIWITLLAIGIIVAVGKDVSDLSSDKFRNGKELNVELKSEQSQYIVSIAKEQFNQFYSISEINDIQSKAEITFLDSTNGTISIPLSETSPTIWKQLSKAQKKENLIVGKIFLKGNSARIVFDEVKFTTLNSVTNDGIFSSAKTAVTLAIGLIGIMALWLGIMKIAEESGLIARLALLFKPIMNRLFPDVPADHPAMGAMMMNISANMLGLSNAATPFGLKAMEHLNALNKKAGTATDAMCTFLVINTSNVQLIPATVIAIRASLGSHNPTEILGASIVATTVNTIVGVIVVKALSKFSLYKKQLEDNQHGERSMEHGNE